MWYEYQDEIILESQSGENINEPAPYSWDKRKVHWATMRGDKILVPPGVTRRRTEFIPRPNNLVYLKYLANTSKNYRSLTPFPLFERAEKLNDQNKMIVEISSGSKIVSANTDITVTLNGDSVSKVFTSMDSTAGYKYKLTIDGANKWVDVCSGLKKMTFNIKAKNTSWVVGSYTRRNKPTSFRQVMHFEDSTNFILYEYGGKNPAIVRAVLVVDESKKIVAKYQVVKKSDGTYQYVRDSRLTAPTPNTSEKYTFYVAFSRKMQDGTKLIIATPNMKYGKLDLLVLKFFTKSRKVPLYVKSEHLLNTTTTSEIIRDIEDIKEAEDIGEVTGDDYAGYKWRRVDLTVPSQDAANIVGFAISGKSSDGMKLDQDPTTLATVDYKKSEKNNKIEFENYDNNGLALHYLHFDNTSPELQYVKISTLRGSSTENRGEWDITQWDNGKAGIRQDFRDINVSERGLKVVLKADNSVIDREEF